MPTAIASRAPIGRGLLQVDLVRTLRALANACMTKPGLAPGTAGTISIVPPVTAGGIEYMIDGILYAKTATLTNISMSPLAGAANNLSATEGAIIRVEINAAGTVTFVIAGKITIAGTLAADKLFHAENMARVAKRSPATTTIGWIVAIGAITWGTTALVAGTNCTIYDGDPDLGALSLISSITP